MPKTNLPVKYRTLKVITILIGGVNLPWSMFTGYCFGAENYPLGLASLAGQVCVALVDGFIYFSCLETLTAHKT